MKREVNVITIRPALAIALLLVGTVADSTGARAEERRQPAQASTVTHIGIVVDNVIDAAQAYAALVGIDTPAVQTSDPGHGAGPAMTALVELSNVTIELIEPNAESSDPLRQFLTAHGPRVHHIGLENDAGSARDHADVADQLGVVFEYGSTEATPARVTVPPLARPTCVTHLGIVVRDIARARRDLAALLGVEPTPIGQFEEVRGPAQYTAFRFQNVSIELLQQVGDTGHYADFIRAGGPRGHHLGLHLRRQEDSLSMAEQIARLERHDGVMAVNAGGFAYIDLRPQLGVFVEALEQSTNDAVYPHPHPAR